MIKLKSLLKSLVISLGTGVLASILTMGSMSIYQEINRPSLAPKATVFPIVWTILYILMGISSYLIYESNAKGKDTALKVYIIQLALNFTWSLIFFNARAFLFSFIWIILLWLAVILMIKLFYEISPLAALLQVPYLLWITFAAYLNFMIYILN